jgi:hypothetical protein
MEDTRRVKFNVGGRIFEMTWATLKRIPTLYHMMTDCRDESEMFIDRSPMLFEQVFAFVVDEKHPFPLRYSYELDWYDVVYDKKSLVDDQRYEKTKLMFAILQNGINSRMPVIPPSWSRCQKTDCGKLLLNPHKPLCDQCINRCLLSHCINPAKTTNYCKEHRKTASICNEKGCYLRCIQNHSFCCNHWEIIPK